MVLVSTENKCYSFHGSVGVVMFDCKVSQLLQYYLLNSLSTAIFRKMKIATRQPNSGRRAAT